MPGNGKATVKAFRVFLRAHQGKIEHIIEVVCGMLGALLSAVPKHLPNAQITVDWFPIGKTFSDALNEVRKAESRIKPLPKNLRWAVIKRGEVYYLTTNPLKATAELLPQGLNTATACRIKERLRWVRLARTPRAARARARGYRNTKAFLTMAYLIGSPAGAVLNST